jgi:hypothetical protein
MRKPIGTTATTGQTCPESGVWKVVGCVFRCIRPPIPLATGHPFQCKPATLG